MLYTSCGQQITRRIANQVFDLDREGLSQRGIAIALGIGRTTVDRIIRGEGLGCEMRTTTVDGESHTGPKERCLICGAMVYAPCLVCVRKIHVFSQKGVSEVDQQITAKDPTPEEIEERKAKIRKGWTESKRSSRQFHRPTVFTVPDLSNEGQQILNPSNPTPTY